MKKLCLESLFFALVFVFPGSTIAGESAGITFSLPPLITFESPPEVVVIPETYIYAVPDVDSDIFFYDGVWWRSWEGRWYQSPDYRSGWQHYEKVPVFYKQIPPGWRNDYKNRHWKGHPWNYQRIPHKQVQQNWKGWKKHKHWETEHYWGVQGMHPRTQQQQLHQKTDPKYHKDQPQQSHQQKGKHEKGNGKK